MFSTHTTNAGETMLIASMDDHHLMAVIKNHAQKVYQSIKVLKNEQPEDPLVRVFQPRLSKDAMQERAKASIMKGHVALYEYVMEASLRGLPVTSILQKAYSRDSAIPLNEFGGDDGGDDFHFLDDRSCATVAAFGESIDSLSGEPLVDEPDEESEVGRIRQIRQMSYEPDGWYESGPGQNY